MPGTLSIAGGYPLVDRKLVGNIFSKTELLKSSRLCLRRPGVKLLRVRAALADVRGESTPNHTCSGHSSGVNESTANQR